MSTYTFSPNPMHLNEEYDVIVAGGGPAGCAAATAAAREGKKTLLIESNYSLGGMGTLGLVPFFCGFHDREKITARGLAEKVLISCRDNTPHLKKQMSENPFSTFTIDPELLKGVYDEMVTQAGVDILFGTQVCDVEMADSERIETIIVSNKSKLSAYRASIYIDCTGDGDLAAWAGAEFEKGIPEDGVTQAGFIEKQGGMQPATLCFTITNIDDYALENLPRLNWSNPDGAIRKAVESSDYPLIEDLHSVFVKIAPRTYGFNVGHLFDVDCTDPHSVTRNMLRGRQMVAQYLDAFKTYHPAFANAYLCATGGILGVRESRRIIGDYMATIDDYRARRSFPDEICRCAYGADVHSQREESTAISHRTTEEIIEFINNVMEPLDKGESFGLPYRCLTPKTLKNTLVAGRCISTDRRANGSVRIMACCLNTGEAAGIAAAMALSDSGDIHRVDTDALRSRLRDHGAYLP